MVGTTLATVRVGGKDLTAIDMLNSRRSRLSDIIPGISGLSAEQMIRIAQFEVQRNQSLASCTPMSILSSVYDAARLGLLLGREAHLVPYRDTCKMIPDFRGYITLVYRSGLVKLLDAKTVFEGDHFIVDEGTNMNIEHRPDYSLDRTDPKKILYFYCVTWLKDAPRPIFTVFNRKDVDRIRASSAMKDGIPWKDWYDRMGLKSVIKYHTDKRLPVTKVTTDLIELDNRVEAGKVSRLVDGESDDELARALAEETEARQEDLKMKLQEEKDRLARSSKREPGEEG